MKKCVTQKLQALKLDHIIQLKFPLWCISLTGTIGFHDSYQVSLHIHSYDMYFVKHWS